MATMSTSIWLEDERLEQPCILPSCAERFFGDLTGNAFETAEDLPRRYYGHFIAGRACMTSPRRHTTSR